MTEASPFELGPSAALLRHAQGLASASMASSATNLDAEAARALDGKVAVVTGSSRGIGRAVVRELARCGASVVVNYYTSRELAEDLASELRANGARAVAIGAGVAEPDEVKRLIEGTVEAFGKIDILVNNAGVNRDRTIRRLSHEEWREVLSTDLDSIYYCTSAVVPYMIENTGGRIVNISSIIGQMGNVGQANYAAAKAGTIGFTKAVAQELVRYNITVNVVCPGFIETDMVKALSDDVKGKLLERIPMRRFGQPEEVATLVRYLVSEGNYITGQQFNVNGGMYM
jgi:acetoacetyl-CoA reductase